MASPIEFWFDFSSPYGYLAAQRIEALAARHGREVDWRPMLLGVAFKVAGTAPLTEVPLKGDYSKRDFERSARFHGIDGFRLPSRFPIASQAPARILLWAKSRDPASAARVAKAMLRAYWVEDRDISNADVAAAAAATAGVDVALARAAVDDPAWKDALKREVDAGLARGVFGSPFVIADGEPFWGLDRFDQLDWSLASAATAEGRVRAVSHVRLVVADLPGAIAFYRDVLGLKLAVDAPGVYAEFDTPGARLALVSEATMGAVVGRPAPRAGDAVVVCLRVDDVDAAAARVTSRGATLVREPHDQPAWLQRVAHLRDPAGNLVELWTRLAPSSR
ncbi:2-hydroxychromene-2-carboxylate isomerase [Burkholderiales bacterium]|nr:2-hydroxychromene-2-carboxylate isomerase [Burkholderiales bacterium]